MIVFIKLTNEYGKVDFEIAKPIFSIVIIGFAIAKLTPLIVIIGF